MGTTAIAHLKYDLDRHAVDLRRIATLASAYFMPDYQTRREYLREVEEFINNINRRFKNTFDINERMRLIYEMRAESELASQEYQILRQGNYTKYLITDIYEDQGVIKYAKIGWGVATGTGQAVGGALMANLGRKLHSRKLKGYGVILFAHGLNNAYESISPIIYEHEHKDSGFLRDIYRNGAGLVGLNQKYGDLAYSAVDFTITAYAGYRGLVLKNHGDRLATSALFEKPGTGMMFRNLKPDYRPKWDGKGTPMRIVMVGTSVVKAKILFFDGTYELNDE
ncbi:MULTISPECIES: DUF4225 domain-containing protein [Serratia]|nr:MULTISPECIES: DUF4225 domain-containing protein [Serratia]NBJ33557.1 DUF4225 domain-containing protein [Serratia fonticola]NCG50969.1 DUF4225 domain-containing protein [Serratia fonticola]OCJ20998.1 hypothetical protein A6U95_13835 [Serratia sp. 14-2641]WMT13495.1 DUF4225 domain-containing protein [Serratia fonticola]CAI1678945.1 Uncharacterised protein [Serratia fonticola]